MASIHRRPRSPYYWAAFRQAGRLIFRSTKSENKNVAFRIADEMEQAGKAATAGNLVEAQARKILASIMERAGSGETLRAPTIGAFINSWLKSRGAVRTEATMERYGFALGAFVSFIGERAKRPLTALSASDVQRFVDGRLRDGVSPTTARLDAAVIRAALNTARRQGIIPTNVAEAVELPEIRAVERGIFTPTEVRILVDAAEDEWKTLILLGYYSGQRLGDCVRLEWAQVDLGSGTISLKQQKTGRAVVIPIHPELTAQLEALATSDQPQRHVMPGMAGLGSGGRDGLSEGFKRIVRQAGLDLGEVQGGGKRKQSRRTFHALRHSFTSALANAGVAPEVRMKLTGHKSADTHKGYTHHELETLRAAVSKLESLK